MLQINTGRLFHGPIQKENQLRGVLYTNLHLEYMRENACSSPLFGKLVQTSESGSSPSIILYDFVERIEFYASGAGTLVSRGANAYLRDMSSIVTLFFDCICSPDIELVRRLIGESRGVSTGLPAKAVIPRIFDKDRFLEPGTTDQFVNFLEKLLCLERTTFLSVMRSIRTYVTGLHRVADDLELAYTLMVAAGESLAQDFDGYVTEWESLSETKRNPVDLALDGADADMAARVRNAIIKNEHVALGRRYQNFVVNFVRPEYFEGQFEEGSFPPGKSEIPDLMREAYQARSGYIHQLKKLPDGIAIAGIAETVIPANTRQRMLTLHGLARLTRHVLVSFVEAQSTVAGEKYNYQHEIAGVVTVRLAPSMWLANVDSDIGGTGRDRLEGFLEQLSNALQFPHREEVTDITDLLMKFSTCARNLKKPERRPYWFIWLLFNAVAGKKAIPIPDSLSSIGDVDIAELSIEILLIHSFLGVPISNDLDSQRNTIEAYRGKRGNKSGIRLPRLLEAMISIELAERYREIGKSEISEKLLLSAADNFPEHRRLRCAAKEFTSIKTLVWRKILLEPRPASALNHSVEMPDFLRRLRNRLSAQKSRRKPTKRRVESSARND